jgi:hypothetical protein
MWLKGSTSCPALRMRGTDGQPEPGSPCPAFYRPALRSQLSFRPLVPDGVGPWGYTTIAEAALPPGVEVLRV